jgi:putative flippase GtrA
LIKGSSGSVPPETDRSDRKLRGTALHILRFLASGTLALLVDAAILALLNRGFGFDPFVSRLVAISIAMVVGWLAHRSITFSLQRPPTIREFLGYASVAWMAAAVNYGVYAGILIAQPATPPLISLFIASLITMVLSYTGMRFGVFGSPGSGFGPR